MRRFFLMLALPMFLLCGFETTHNACMEVTLRYPDAFPLSIYPYEHNSFTQDDLPNGTPYEGPKFRLSQDYPKQITAGEDDYPWLRIWFKDRDPKKAVDYMRSVLSYAYKDNLANNWYVTKETQKRWFHAPWMNLKMDSTYKVQGKPIYLGREYIHGMTFELPSAPHKLDASQAKPCQNWAISLYNAPGGMTIGKVWNKASRFIKPSTEDCLFPHGTVAIKLLFTEADEAAVPWLHGSPEWDAHILIPAPDGSAQVPPYLVKEVKLNNTSIYVYKRAVKKLRLLQIDIAVRDEGAPSGWVFGTFVYRAPEAGKHRHFTGVAHGSDVAWDDVVPVGLTWGNDPKVVPGEGKPVRELWLNPSAPAYPGWGGRLDGPVDNPQSSCLSCHSTGVTYRIANNAFAGTVPAGRLFENFNEYAKYQGKKETDIPFEVRDRVTEAFFRNLKRGEPFAPHYTSTDLSLQLSEGLHNFSTTSELASPGHGTNGDFLMDAANKSRGQPASLAPRSGR